jgi:hypothetical protein
MLFHIGNAGGDSNLRSMRVRGEFRFRLPQAEAPDNATSAELLAGQSCAALSRVWRLLLELETMKMLNENSNVIGWTRFLLAPRGPDIRKTVQWLEQGSILQNSVSACKRFE